MNIEKIIEINKLINIENLNTNMPFALSADIDNTNSFFKINTPFIQNRINALNDALEIICFKFNKILNSVDANERQEYIKYFNHSINEYLTNKHISMPTKGVDFYSFSKIRSEE